MHETQAQLPKFVIVHIDFSKSGAQAESQDDLAECVNLVSAAQAIPIAQVIGTRSMPDPRLFAGTGKVEEIKQVVEQYQADAVLFNHSLTPNQQRNLSKILGLPVLDRTQLILDIFAQRARTYEGKLQVELAQLQHQTTRLVRGWTHLERQKGGIGLRGGPGETQLEIDRRLLRDRIKTIKERLEKVRMQRAQLRQKRKRKPVPVVSLVGYTNAGKSTLFNALTKADVFAANQLFATLDPTLRRIVLDKIGEVVLVDTVGFIRHLPHNLVAAFKATLEETQEADLLLHVIDSSDPRCHENIDAVNAVLEEIGAESVPQIKVFNKIDLLAEQTAQIDYDTQGERCQVWLSAHSGTGLEQLRTAIIEKLSHILVDHTICLTNEQGKLRAKLYELKAVKQETIDEQGSWHLQISLPKSIYEQLFPEPLVAEDYE
jgi:GTP-binding protein HflX